MHDYVIVGAGSAGCVLANRLTEDPRISVLLLEAGGTDRQQEIHIPAAFPKLFKGTCDWAYYTEEQSQLKNRRLYWPRGKVLGGSSSINAMIYIRGNPHDYDQWRELGNEGWAFANVLPYFKRAEHQERGASEYHGVGGPLHVADLRCINPLSRAFIQACKELGFRWNSDFNGPEQEGVGYYQVTQKHGQRWSAAAAYIKPILKRPNLTIGTNVQVTRLTFDKRRATGVEYVENGEARQVAVNREVIVCGGTINSPQLLMLSGVGPADHLKALGIPVVVDLPGVGQNLQDHLMVGAVCECTRPVGLASAEKLRHVLNYLLFKKGPLTSNIAEAGGFIKTRPHLSLPDVQLLFGPVYYMSHGFENPEGHGFSIGATVLRPRSRGQIRLRSSNPADPPIIQPNYLENPADLAVFVDAVRLARRLVQTDAFLPFRGREVWPGPDAQSDEGIREHIRNTAETLYHPVGTCKMGSDPLAVVDAGLRVHGIEGLRIVDASVMPTLIGGNTNAPTIMIAEKAADIIRETSHVTFEPVFALTPATATLAVEKGAPEERGQESIAL